MNLVELLEEQEIIDFHTKKWGDEYPDGNVAIYAIGRSICQDVVIVRKSNISKNLYNISIYCDGEYVFGIRGSISLKEIQRIVLERTMDTSGNRKRIRHVYGDDYLGDMTAPRYTYND